MKAVQSIINRAGGFEAVKERYINLVNEPYMRLVVEVLTSNPADGSHTVSVAHYGEQNGDAMRDPEIVFWVVPAADKRGFLWWPLSIQQDYLGQYDECARCDRNGYRLTNLKLATSINRFARTWSRNIALQGFTKLSLQPS